MKNKKQKNLFTYGNKKLNKDIAIFDLPAGAPATGQFYGTCGRLCPGCYAIKAEKCYKNVLPARRRNLAASFSPGFVNRAILELLPKVKSGRVTAVRVHSAGDFYSNAYAAKWYRIAEYFRHIGAPVMFYAYTKRTGRRALGEVLRLKMLSNFVLIDSMQYGEISGAVNYGTAEELKPARAAGAFMCPCGTAEDKSKQTGARICGASCTYCQTKCAQKFAPVFLKH